MTVLAKALYLGAKHAVPPMRQGGGGAIVNLASVHSVLQEVAMLVYEAGKVAVGIAPSNRPGNASPISCVVIAPPEPQRLMV